MIPYGHQSVDEDDIAAVVEVLRGDWLTQGPAIERFERDLAEAVGAKHVIAFSSGTAALHAAVAVSGIGPGDRVATSALTFIASANCARYVGATPVVVDIDPDTLNIDLTQVPPDCRAVVAVHYAGLPVRLDKLDPRPQVVIEDAAHALGAHTPDGPVGNCALSDLCAFSFHPVKAITTGEGGAVSTNSAHWAEALRRFRHHGTTPVPERGGWYAEARSLGYNYRITDMQAALGSSQLRRLTQFVSRRTELADRYRAHLLGLPITLPPMPTAGWRHAYHLFPIRVAERRRVFEGLRGAGIGVQVHYLPVYRHPLYADLGVQPSNFPATEAAYEALLSLPLYPGLTETEQDVVVTELTALLSP